MTADLETFRGEVREWCRTHVPPGWRAAQTAVPDDEFVSFQQAWFAELRGAGYAVPHWPAEWGGGMSTAEQVVLYQELAAHDAPRLVLAFVSIHHAASTLLHAGTPTNNATDTFPPSSTARSGARGSPSPMPAPTSPASRPARAGPTTASW